MNQKEWTVMIYMAGDNNLAVDMAYAMEQIKSSARPSENSPNLFVYYDGNSSDIPTLYCDFTDPKNPKYIRSYKLNNKLFPVAPKENENAADPRSILNFVDWCVNKVPVKAEDGVRFGRKSKKYALIFSGHSLGFQDIGLFRDETAGKTLKMRDFTQAIHRISATNEELASTMTSHNTGNSELFGTKGEILGQKLDILGFDSCVMGMLEVGFQFRNLAKVMISSEGSVPSAGWTYAKILGDLANEESADSSPETVAQNFVRDFIHSQDSYTVGGVSVDMAAWDLTKIRDLAVSLDKLSAALLECLSNPESKPYGCISRALLQAHWQCQSYMYDQNVDIVDFCELLSRECSFYENDLSTSERVQISTVRERCDEVISEVKNVVLLSGFSGGAYQYSNGISLFFPWSREAYEVSRKNYESLWIVKESDKPKLNWNKFLQKYLFEAARRKFQPPEPSFDKNSKYRYFAGIRFDDVSEISSRPETSTKIAGQEGTKIAGQEGTKIAGQEGTKIAGQEGTKIAGQEGTKIAGQEGTKIAGQEETKIAGQEGTKIAGQEGTKIAGSGASAFFNNFRLFKNIESRWNISGFSHRPKELKTRAIPGSK